MDFSYLTVIPRGRQIWDYAVFQAEEFEERHARLAELLKKLDLDGFIVYSDALSRRYVSYLTNYCNSVSWSSSVCLITADEAPYVISSMAPRDINYNLKSLSPRVNLNAVGLDMISNHRVAVKAAEYLKEQNLLGKKWGAVNLGSLNYIGAKALSDVLPDIPDCTAAVDEIIAEKSENELFAIGQATALAKKAVTDYLRLAVPGANEREIAAQIDRNFRVFGVDNIALLVSAGKDKKLSLHQPHDYVIQEGDTVSAQVDILYLHYNGMYAASFYRGLPDEERAAFYKQASERFEAAKKAALGGKALDEINSLENGYVLVNGIGSDTSEPPFAGPMAKNTSYTLVVSAENEKFGGVILADTFVADENNTASLGGHGLNRVFWKA